MRYRVAPAVLAAALLSFLFAPPALADDLVPDVVGLELDRAKSLLDQAGYESTLTFDASKPAGIVFGQTPGGLATRPKGTRVTLSVGGASPAPAPGPELPPAGPAPRDPAPRDPAPRDPVPADPMPADPVSSTPEPAQPSTPAPGGDDLGTPPGGELPPDPLGDPPTGTPDKPAPTTPDPLPPAPGPDVTPPPGPAPTPDPGSEVAADPSLDALPWAPRLNRRGPEIPDVLGQTRAAARTALSEWRVREELTLSVPSLVGTVINQWPMPGMTLAPGEEVTVQVAVGQSPSIRHRSVPVTIGKSLKEAEQELRRFGFTSQVRKVRSRASRYGMAVWQQPMAGSLSLEGEVVLVHVGVGDGTPRARTPSVTPKDPAPVEPGPVPVDPIPGLPDAPTAPTAPKDPAPADPDAPPAGMPALPPLGPQPGTEPKPPADPPKIPDLPPAGPLPPAPGPKDPGPKAPPPKDPAPRDPVPQDPPEMRSPIARPTLISPPAGESYPRAYGATFEWSKVPGATGYEWEMEEEQPSGAWRKVDSTAVKGTRYRPDNPKRGRYRWRVRGLSGDRKGDWSGWFRLYMY